MQHFFYNLMTTILFLLAVILGPVASQNIYYNTTPYDITLFQQATPLLLSDPSSIFSPDSYRTFQISTNYIFTLGNNNIVQVYLRTNPRLLLQNYTQHSFANSTEEMFYLAVDQNQTKMVLTSSTNSVCKHHIHSIGTDGALTYLGVRGDLSSKKIPIRVYMKSTEVYTFFSGYNQLYITNITTNVSKFVGLPISKIDAKATLDRQRVILWDISNAQLYIHAMNSSFNQLFYYGGSKTGSGDVPESVNLNSNGQLFILEVNGKAPVRVINVTTGTVVLEIALNQKIYCANFMDSLNRFILMQTDIGNIVYDTAQNITSYLPLTGSLASISTKVDSQSGLLHNIGSSNVISYGMNVSVNGSVIVGYYLPQVVVPLNITVAPEEEFVVEVNYTEIQNFTIQSLENALGVMNQAIDNSFSFIFSTPITTFFLTTLNYFTLISLYVLLNLKIPYSVFIYLSQLYRSCQATILQDLGIALPVQQWSSERVTNDRALYFNVSSDLLTANRAVGCILIANVVLVELLIFLAGKKCFNFREIHRVLRKQRGSIYLGLIVSNMISVILPWKTVLEGGNLRNFGSKMNLAAYFLLLGGLLIMILGSFMIEVRAAIKERKKHYVRIGLRKWWVNYQNFIYPLLVLLDNPLWFLIPVALSQLVYLFNSLTVPNFRVFAIMKALYPILFHSCFFVFLYCHDNGILAVTSIACLLVFLLGGIHHFLETIIKVGIAVYKMVKKFTQTAKEERGQVKKSKLKLKRHQNICDTVDIQTYPNTLGIKSPPSLKAQINKIQRIDKNAKTAPKNNDKESKEGAVSERKKDNSQFAAEIKKVQTPEQVERIVKEAYEQTPRRRVEKEFIRQFEEQLKTMGNRLETERRGDKEREKKVKAAKDSPNKDAMTVRQRPKVRWADQ